MLLFSGCKNSTHKNVEPITSGFSCNFSVEDNDFSGTLNVDNNYECIFHFESPIDMVGTIITVTNDTVLIEANEYTKRFDTQSIPQDSFVLNVQNILKNISENKMNVNNKILQIEGECINGKYKSEFLPTGIIKSLQIFNTETKINFTNVLKNHD